LLSRTRKAGLVVGGYAAALLLAWGAVRLQATFTSNPDPQASAGMAAFGDAVLFLAVFGLAAIPPTVLLIVWILRRSPDS